MNDELDLTTSQNALAQAKSALSVLTEYTHAKDMAAKNYGTGCRTGSGREAASAPWYAEDFLHRHAPASSSECADALTAGSSLKTAFVRVMAAD